MPSYAVVESAMALSIDGGENVVMGTLPSASRRMTLLRRGSSGMLHSIGDGTSRGEEGMTVASLQQMKREGRKIVGVVVYDYQMAQIVDRAGVDIVSVGDSVGVNMWGQQSELDVTLDEMLLACKAVRRGVTRALVSCDFPYGPLQEDTEAALRVA